MSDTYRLDENNQPVPCELHDWALWFERCDRHVALDKIDNVKVSTVFLGLDHSFDCTPGHVPVLWETMIFGGEHDGYQDRYTSHDAAVAGHQVALALVKA